MNRTDNIIFDTVSHIFIDVTSSKISCTWKWWKIFDGFVLVKSTIPKWYWCQLKYQTNLPVMLDYCFQFFFCFFSLTPPWVNNNSGRMKGKKNKPPKNHFTDQTYIMGLISADKIPWQRNSTCGPLFVYRKVGTCISCVVNPHLILVENAYKSANRSLRCFWHECSIEKEHFTE